MESILIPILADEVHDHTRVDTLHPTAIRAIVEQTGVPAVMRKRATSARALETTTELAHNGLEFATRNRLKVDVRVIRPIPGRSECSPIAMPQSCGVEYLDRLEVPGTDFDTAQVLNWVDDIDNRTACAVSNNTRWTNASVSSGGIDHKLCIQRAGITAQIDMHEVSRQSQALQWRPPFTRRKHASIRVLVGDLGSQIRIEACLRRVNGGRHCKA